MDTQERVMLVDSLDTGGIITPFAPMSRSAVALPNPIKGTGECGLIVGSAMHGCIDGLSVDNKYAVVNSQLLAERAANAKFDSEAQPKEWFKFYLRVLGICGWTTQGSEFTTYTAQERTETLDRVSLSILRSLGGLNSGRFCRVVERTYGALRTHTNASNRFHQKATQSGTAKFRILPCMQTQDGNVVMVLTSMQASSKTQSTSISKLPGHFWELNCEQTDLRYAAAECMLNTQVYNSAKAQIEQKLAGNTASLIDALDLD